MDDGKTTARKTKRPASLDLPYDLPPSPPVPKPEEPKFTKEPGRTKPDPVRYGDWESKGIAIDF